MRTSCGGSQQFVSLPVTPENSPGTFSLCGRGCYKQNKAACSLNLPEQTLFLVTPTRVQREGVREEESEILITVYD